MQYTVINKAMRSYSRECLLAVEIHFMKQNDKILMHLLHLQIPGLDITLCMCVHVCVCGVSGLIGFSGMQ